MFYKISSFCAGLFLLLGATLVFLPEMVYWLFGLPQNELGDFLAKRAAMLFLGFSVLCFLSRNTQSTDVRRIVSAAVWVSMGGMALIGAYEFLRGYAGIGIWMAIMIETVTSVLFFRIWLMSDNPENDRDV
ncbi:MAG: hypothetical protein L3J36_08075 [Rhodobacteraceae bacterium]|nr:hypothetical protein [Paracoccaceae bacterium]